MQRFLQMLHTSIALARDAKSPVTVVTISLVIGEKIGRPG